MFLSLRAAFVYLLKDTTCGRCLRRARARRHCARFEACPEARAIPAVFSPFSFSPPSLLPTLLSGRSNVCRRFSAVSVKAATNKTNERTNEETNKQTNRQYLDPRRARRPPRTAGVPTAALSGPLRFRHSPEQVDMFDLPDRNVQTHR